MTVKIEIVTIISNIFFNLKVRLVEVFYNILKEVIDNGKNK